MPTDEIIIRLFCMVDDQLGPFNKRLDAHLYLSEIVTIGLLFALKGASGSSLMVSGRADQLSAADHRAQTLAGRVCHLITSTIG